MTVIPDMARKAEEYLISTGLADTSYWGPEAEFYIFDDVRFGQNQFSGYYFVDSVEGAWNSGEFEEETSATSPDTRKGTSRSLPRTTFKTSGRR